MLMPDGVPQDGCMTSEYELYDTAHLLEGRSAKSVMRELRIVIAVMVGSFGLFFLTVPFEDEMAVTARLIVWTPLLVVIVVTIVWLWLRSYAIPDLTRAEQRAGYTTRRDCFPELPQVDPASRRVIRPAGMPLLTSAQERDALQRARSLPKELA
jgi:hypothetical protein